MATTAPEFQVTETPRLCRGEWVAGKYRIERVLGEGGMAVVYRATHEGLGSPVAIKVIRRELAAVESAAARMMLEARAVAALQSHHVPRVFDVGRLDSGLVFIVMEFLEGRDLYEVVQQSGALPEALAVDYVLQACEALAEAHAHGIVHRDLKPENLFLATGSDGSSIIKVLDFGVSKRTVPDAARARLTSPSHIVGSVHYMPPEQMRGADVDQRADIYSLGVILFELVTGAPPFDAESVPAVCAKVLKEPAPKLRAARPEASAKLEAVVDRCLCKNPDGRFADVAELAAALAELGSPAARDSADRISRVLARKALHASLSDVEVVSADSPSRATENLTLASVPPARRAPRWWAVATTLIALAAALGSQLTSGEAHAEELRAAAALAPSGDRIKRAVAVLSEARPEAHVPDPEIESVGGPVQHTAQRSAPRPGRRSAAVQPQPAAAPGAAEPRAADPWSPESFGNRY